MKVPVKKKAVKKRSPASATPKKPDIKKVARKGNPPRKSQLPIKEKEVPFPVQKSNQESPCPKIKLV